MNIQFVRNSVNATFSLSQKSHYARTRCWITRFNITKKLPNNFSSSRYADHFKSSKGVQVKILERRVKGQTTLTLGSIALAGFLVHHNFFKGSPSGQSDFLLENHKTYRSKIFELWVQESFSKKFSMKDNFWFKSI